MDPQDLEPRSKPAKLKPLDDLSIEALRDYIAELETEIARVRAAIAGKEKARASAETFFRR